MTTKPYNQTNESKLSILSLLQAVNSGVDLLPETQKKLVEAGLAEYTIRLTDQGVEMLDASSTIDYDNE